MATADEITSTVEAIVEAELERREVEDELAEAQAELRYANRRLEDLDNVMLFMSCLEREVGEDVDGDDLERHITRGTPEAEACREELRGFGRAEKRARVEEIVNAEPEKRP